MKIVFVARHGPFDNMDEDSITYALQQLGHEVTCIQERIEHRNGPQPWEVEADLCLALKWPYPYEMEKVSRRMPLVFWHFDMIRSVSNDPTLLARSRYRVAWCQDVYPYITAGFLTDGDYVKEDKGGKLYHLPQGFDERQAGYGMPTRRVPPILFTGMVRHGQKRAEHIEHLQKKWGDEFKTFGDGGPRSRVHGRELADLFASTKIVVAPDGPGTDAYWSNRAVLTTGLGGFLLHPACGGLEKYLTSGSDLIYYNSREHLDELIRYYLDNPEKREVMRQAGHRRCLEANLYQHRCKELLDIVKERM